MRAVRKTGILTPALAAAACLAACQSNPLASAPLDPSSPIAAEIAAVSAKGGPAPSFADIPPIPADQRAPGAWARAAGETRQAQEDLAANTGPKTWSLQNTETFAAKARADVRDEPPSERSGGDADSFAREGQQRATPPPPPR